MDRMDKTGKAAFAAREAVIWQLVISGTLPAAQLADELERHAGFAGAGGPMVQTLARVARAAAYPTLLDPRRDGPRWNRHPRWHG